jgi:tetratricopeptide (TPR) repeat protein
VLKKIPIKTFLSKFVLVVFSVFLGSSFLIFAKWCFGNSISTQVSENVLAEFAVNLAPADPQTHYSLAVVNESTFLPEGFAKSSDEFQRALSLSPYDYRLWLSVAKTLERSGDANGAESAFNKSLELAPNYAHVHWAYGNFMLRQGKTEKAFAEIRKAAQSNNIYLQPAISAAWEFLNGDLTKIRQFFGASPELNSMLALFLTHEKRFDEALEIWNSLDSADVKTRFMETGNQVFQQMVAAKKYRHAIEVYNSISAESDLSFAKERIFNGSFEKDVKPENANVFDWQLGTAVQPQILFDAVQKSEGNRSLVVVLNSTDGSDFRNISQIVVVRPGGKYRLSFAYKSELKTSATFRWEVADSEGKLLSESDAVAKESDWQRVDMSFTTPQNSESITIGLARAACRDTICPISGKVWFDDFRLSF